MNSKYKHFLIEGVDRLGKDTLINGLLDTYGYHQVIHYQKPERLRSYAIDDEQSFGSEDHIQLFRYQQASFENMFSLLGCDAKTIMNRAHLGEYVYSPLYRRYSGNYVFDLEVAAMEKYPKLAESTLLILLVTSSFAMITDDGKSFDFSKKEQEQDLFCEAYNRSNLPNKMMIDVHNGFEGFIGKHKVLDMVLHQSRRT